jgi:glyoxalase superfamily protein
VSDQAPAIAGIAALAIDCHHPPEQALALSATRADDVHDGGRWQVPRDPEGNELCLLRPRP